MKLSPTHSLGLLILIGLSIAGWCYGIYWKRVASGNVFTQKERVLIQLQDQIRVLNDKNAELNAQVSRLTGADEKITGKYPVDSIPTGAPIEPGVLAPFEEVELPKKGSKTSFPGIQSGLE